MAVQNLGTVPLSVVHQAFVQAFMDYEVSIPMPFDKFAEMVKTRDLRLDYSWGWFEDDQLVGFIVCGYREQGGRKVCYDGGTGVVKEYRRRGIGKRLLDQVIEDHKARGIDAFVLEVLENNRPAYDLYASKGFRTTRMLDCLEVERAALPEVKAADFGLKVERDPQLYRSLDLSSLLEYQPSWQDARASVLNNADKLSLLTLVREGEPVGVGTVHTTRGGISHIGIRADLRATGLEEAVLGELKAVSSAEKLVASNVEEGTAVHRALVRSGFRSFVRQFEMELAY